MVTGQTSRSTSGNFTVTPGSATPTGGGLYRCRAELSQVNGTFVATAVEVPDFRGTGADEREAIENLSALLADLIRSHKAAGTPVPWVNRECPTVPGMKLVLVRI